MPSIDLRIDGQSNRIDSPDYELCGKWLGDLLKQGHITPATMVQLTVRPYLVPANPADWREPWVPDWNIGGRHMDTYAIGGERTPAGAARKLARYLTDFADELDGTQAAAVR